MRSLIPYCSFNHIQAGLFPVTETVAWYVLMKISWIGQSAHSDIFAHQKEKSAWPSDVSLHFYYQHSGPYGDKI